MFSLFKWALYIIQMISISLDVTFIDPNFECGNWINQIELSANVSVWIREKLFTLILIAQFFLCVWIKQDSWEDEDEEAKEDEKSDETEVVRKAKPQKNLTKKIAEREVSPPKTPKISTRITTLNFFIT